MVVFLTHHSVRGRAPTIRPLVMGPAFTAAASNQALHQHLHDLVTQFRSKQLENGATPAGRSRQNC